LAERESRGEREIDRKGEKKGRRGRGER